jgi:hypothetical protein
MPFEINVVGVTGQIQTAYLVEHAGVSPVNIISFGQDFDAHIEWYLCSAWPPPGDWLLSLHLESMGSGAEYDLPVVGPDRVATNTGVDCAPGPPGPCLCWTHDIQVPAGTVAAGTYKAVVTITWERTPGNPGPMAGFADLRMMQVYVP